MASVVSFLWIYWNMNMLSKCQHNQILPIFSNFNPNHVYREVAVAVANTKGCSPAKTKADPSETKTVKHVLNYIPFQAAFEADPSQLSKRSWQRIKSHFVMMKSNSWRNFVVITAYSNDVSSYATIGLMIFRSQMKRDPEVATRQEDVEKLCEIRDHIQHEMKIDNQVLDSNAFE